MSQLGDRLKSVREGLNLRQRDISTRFKISQNAVSKYEAGLREPPISFICGFCKEFNISSDYLLGLSDIQILTQQNNKSSLSNQNPLSGLNSSYYQQAETYISFLRQQQAIQHNAPTNDKTEIKMRSAEPLPNDDDLEWLGFEW